MACQSRERSYEGISHWKSWCAPADTVPPVSLSCWWRALREPHSLPAGLSAHSAPLLLLLSAECSWRQGAQDSQGEPRSLAKKSKCSQWERVVQLSESGFQLWQIVTDTFLVSGLWRSRRRNEKLAESHTLLSALDVIHLIQCLMTISANASFKCNLNVKCVKTNIYHALDFFLKEHFWSTDALMVVHYFNSMLLK